MAYFVDMVYTVHVGLGSWGAEGAEGAEGARLYGSMSKSRMEWVIYMIFIQSIHNNTAE